MFTNRLLSSRLSEGYKARMIVKLQPELEQRFTVLCGRFNQSINPLRWHTGRDSQASDFHSILTERRGTLFWRGLFFLLALNGEEVYLSPSGTVSLNVQQSYSICKHSERLQQQEADSSSSGTRMWRVQYVLSPLYKDHKHDEAA